jgi:hypothetical protein
MRARMRAVTSIAIATMITTATIVPESMRTV